MTGWVRVVVGLAAFLATVALGQHLGLWHIG